MGKKKTTIKKNESNKINSEIKKNKEPEKKENQKGKDFFKCRKIAANGQGLPRLAQLP